MGIGPFEKHEVIKMYTIVAKEGMKVVGLGIGSVYEHGTMCRTSQWQFGENKHRELWIDYLWSSKDSSCSGREILNRLESKLKQHSVERKNIYVVSVHEATGFYTKCGYTEIHTKDTDDDDDYPSSYTNVCCIGLWYAKSIENRECPDFEKIVVWDIQ